MEAGGYVSRPPPKNRKTFTSVRGRSLCPVPQDLSDRAGGFVVSWKCCEVEPASWADRWRGDFGFLFR